MRILLAAALLLPITGSSFAGKKPSLAMTCDMAIMIASGVAKADAAKKKQADHCMTVVGAYVQKHCPIGAKTRAEFDQAIWDKVAAVGKVDGSDAEAVKAACP